MKRSTGYKIHICQFDSAGHLEGKKRTYKAVKEAVLEAGRYSVFEATATMKDAALFTRLSNDPELELDRKNHSYPWIGVRRKELPDCSGCTSPDPFDAGPGGRTTHQAGTKQHPEGRSGEPFLERT
jgi:hypothetical protein